MEKVTASGGAVISPLRQSFLAPGSPEAPAVQASFLGHIEKE